MNFQEYVESRSEKLPWTGCHIWSGSTNVGGYATSGRAQREQGTTIVHRALFNFVYGGVSSGLYVCHRCDTPCCVNPDHLFLGSPSDNARDRAVKCRSAPKKGEQNGRSRLTNQDVKKIKSLLTTNLRQREIGEMLGVDQTVISGIKTKKTWGHIQ